MSLQYWSPISIASCLVPEKILLNKTWAVMQKHLLVNCNRTALSFSKNLSSTNSKIVNYKSYG
jgi:hypothetical protein